MEVFESVRSRPGFHPDSVGSLLVGGEFSLFKVSLVLYSNDRVDLKWLRFLPLNAGFVEDFLNYYLVSICSSCARKFRKNVGLGILFAGNISYLYCFEFFHLLEY